MFCMIFILTILVLYSPKFKSWIETKELYQTYLEVEKRKKIISEEIPMNNKEKFLLYGGTALFISGVLKFSFIFFFPELTLPLSLDLLVDKGTSFLGMGLTRISAVSLLMRRSKHILENQKRFVFTAGRWKTVANLMTAGNMGKVVGVTAGGITLLAGTDIVTQHPITVIGVGQPYRLIKGDISTAEFVGSIKTPFKYVKDLRENQEQVKIARGIAIQDNPELFYSAEGGDKTPKVVAIKKGLSDKYSK